MIIYGLATCDTCRKARKALPDAEFRDIRKDGISDATLDAAADHFGVALLNSRSTTWRGLSADERARPQGELLRSHPALMKRPLIVDGPAMYLGWGRDVQDALLS